jgi:hypothetical protein
MRFTDAVRAKGLAVVATSWREDGCGDLSSACGGRNWGGGWCLAERALYNLSGQGFR